MITINNSLQSISQSGNIRMGLAYAKESHALFLTKYAKKCPIRLREVCDIEKGKSITEEEAISGSIPVVAGGKNFAYYHNESNRAGNIITVSASGASSGYVNYWDQPIWASDCITVISKDEKVYITKFIYYLLKLIQPDIFLLQKGADQPHVYSDDVGSIFIPEISYEIQCETLAYIEKTEKEISCLLKDILSIQGIIDSVFAREFSFNFKAFEAIKKKKQYETRIEEFTNNPDLRFSVKFHREAGNYVLHQLSSITDKKIKHFLSEPIVLGASISPDDYSDNEGTFYISMASIKNWRFEAENANFVSDQYASFNSEKTVRKNDIILARSGEGTIGKVALISDDNIRGVFADFTMRIRLKDYNPEFAYYYFRTAYFQYLIEVYKKGLGNNTNIFPINIQEFPLLDISQDEQQRIVDEIHSEISKQDDIKKRIANLRRDIDGIIKQTIIGDDNNPI